jgi:hypothetical protein
MTLDSIESVKNDPEKVIQLAKELKYEASQSDGAVVKGASFDLIDSVLDQIFSVGAAVSERPTNAVKHWARS